MQSEMASSIPVGTLLRQRYLLKQELGQGGFGRTYLAIDQERFGELCVLKEFMVPYQDEALVEKAKTLFQRESSILHQIQHSQIPRFWAAFEQEQRLFLAQDFVQGKTYRALLQERKRQGQAFSEAEILHLLRHLLPVLTYLHDRDIVHRDLSPDNIILRPSETVYGADGIVTTTDALPVLIDFGAVKEATSHWPIVSTLTRVGKIGYAPPEQLQTGSVSPHSDLYALGASCLVLLTGREPQTLLNSQTLNWQWQPYTHLSDDFAAILQKMVALHPGDRYQSAREILADLQPLIGGVQPTVFSPVQPAAAADIEPAARDIRPAQILSTLKSKLPMGTSNSDDEGLDVRHTLIRRPVPPVPSRWKSVTPGLAIVASLTIVTGIGTYLFKTTALPGTTQALNALEKKPESARSTRGVVSNGAPKEIVFRPGEISAIQQGNLQDTTEQPYFLKVAQGQVMTVNLDGATVVMDLIRASNKQPIDQYSATQSRSWAGQIPADDEYIIQVKGTGAYSLDVTISPIEKSPMTDFHRVSFARDKVSTTVTGQSRLNRVQRYALYAKTRQMMSVRVLKGDVVLSVNAPNGQPVGSIPTSSRDWHGKLPMEGEYVIEVTSAKPTDFALSLQIR